MDLQFIIETVDADGNTVEILARTSRHALAIAAWDAAIRSYPNDRLMLRNRALIMRRWPE
jgi:hypothetical protein